MVLVTEGMEYGGGCVMKCSRIHACFAVRKLGMSIVKSQRLRENILKLNAGSTDICGKRMVCGTKGPWSYSDFPSPIPIPPQAPAPLRRLHILVRMRPFEKAWTEEIGRSLPFSLTTKSMSIMLSKIAKFQSFDETLDACKRMKV
ncbi:unnamed protein product [Linum tenue]|uniref:Uncharacterized protein n=1 Tax=Linum tenue TaxID=586396 RepID=A0AAV0RAF3_9ROSI|nr:unnamed protein product [Linum tenue]